MKKYIVVKEWKTYQHYTDRNPPWIKLHRALLNSRTWVMLDNNGRVLAVAIMLLAADTGNKIPLDFDYIKRTAFIKGKIELEPLLAVDFIEIIDDKNCASNLLADASKCLPEERREETEKRQRREDILSDSDFDAFWNRYQKKTGKPEAASEWKKIADPIPSISEILEAVDSYIVATPEKKFRLDPCRWIKRRRWTDEITPEAESCFSYEPKGDSPALDDMLKDLPPQWSPRRV